jgi:hypothetical protein
MRFIAFYVSGGQFIARQKPTTPRGRPPSVMNSHFEAFGAKMPARRYRLSSTTITRADPHSNAILGESQRQTQGRISLFGQIQSWPTEA